MPKEDHKIWKYYNPKALSIINIQEEKKRILKRIESLDKKIELLNIGINDKLSAINEEWIFNKIDIDFLLERREELINQFKAIRDYENNTS